MRFADPYILLLLALIPVVLAVKAYATRSESGGTFSNLSLLASYGRTWRVRFRWLPTAVRVLAVALLIVALARPQNSRAETVVPTEGIDIALVLDTSSSMTGRLGDDSRLTVAQRVIKDFIEGREADRIGLVIFRDSSLVLSPLTLDYAALTALVDSVGQVNLVDGTAIGSGLSDGLNLLRDSQARSRVAVLLTDGQNNAGTIEPLAAARIAETLGIRVYTIGVLDNEGGGENVDETALSEMARITGGRYFPAETEGALETIYENIDQLETSRIETPAFVAYDEIAGHFLLAAVVLLLFELVLRTTVWRQAT